MANITALLAHLRAKRDRARDPGDPWTDWYMTANRVLVIDARITGPSSG